MAIVALDRGQRGDDGHPLGAGAGVECEACAGRGRRAQAQPLDQRRRRAPARRRCRSVRARPAPRRHGRHRRRRDEGEGGAEGEERQVDADPGVRLDPAGAAERERPARGDGEHDAGNGPAEDRWEHRRHPSARPPTSVQPEGLEGGCVAGTPLQVAGDRLGDDDRARGGGDGGEEVERVALERGCPLHGFGVDLLVRHVAERPDVRREVGREASGGRRRRPRATTGSSPAARPRASGRRGASVRRGSSTGGLGRRRGPRSAGRSRRRWPRRSSSRHTRGTAGRSRGRRSPRAIPADRAPRSPTRISSVLPAAG